MSEPSVLIYGANGFTGRLIAERAKERGLRPILAGRNPDVLTTLGKDLDLPVRVFGLDSAAALRDGLLGVSLVIHAAGPYSRTSRPMVDACLAGSVHYLDITGEYAVLEAVLARHAEAKSRGVVLLPAVGFDVVPTDCMAKTLAEALPDATRLELAFTGGMLPSPGTAKTAVEGLTLGAKVRRDGALVTLPAPLTRKIPFQSGEKFGMSIPWGDLVTAYHSTKIPNITVYTVVPRAAARGARFLKYASPLLGKPSVIGFLQRQVEKRATGPTADMRRTARMWIWGRAENERGESVEGHLGVPEGYELTVLGALASAERVLRGEVPPGATTPSLAFGADFVTTLPGVEPFHIVR